MLLSSDEGGHVRKRKNRSRYCLGCSIQYFLNLISQETFHS